MRRLSAFVLHATAVGIMTWGWFKIVDLIQALARKGGHLQFLTNQGLAITWLCMTISLFCDVFPSVTVARRLKKALLMISMPVEFIITSIYWPLLFFLPHLILLPTVASSTTGSAPSPSRLPLQVDLALHALPLLTLLVDFFAFEPKFPRIYVNTAAPAAILAFSVWYVSFVEYYATFNGTFPYPFLTHSPFAVRVVIYTAATGIALGCFRTLNALHA